MKTLLEDLDFEKVKFEPGDKTKLLTGGNKAKIELIRRHADNLRKALVAALGVIDAHRSYVNAQGLKNMQDASQSWEERVAELEAALKVFRKELSSGNN